MRNKSGWLDPNRALHNTPFFWWSLGLPLFVSLLSAVWIGVSNRELLCFTAELSCIQYFFPTYKVPIGIASLGLLLGTLVAQMHRSEQTAEALRVTSNNNSFSNRFKHEEEFTNYARNLPPVKVSDHNAYIKVRSIGGLYGKYFDASLDNFEAIGIGSEKLQDLYKQFLTDIDEEFHTCFPEGNLPTNPERRNTLLNKALSQLGLVAYGESSNGTLGVEYLAIPNEVAFLWALKDTAIILEQLELFMGGGSDSSVSKIFSSDSSFLRGLPRLSVTINSRFWYQGRVEAQDVSL